MPHNLSCQTAEYTNLRVWSHPVWRRPTIWIRRMDRIPPQHQFFDSCFDSFFCSCFNSCFDSNCAGSIDHVVLSRRAHIFYTGCWCCRCFCSWQSNSHQCGSHHTGAARQQHLVGRKCYYTPFSTPPHITTPPARVRQLYHTPWFVRPPRPARYHRGHIR